MKYLQVMPPDNTFLDTDWGYGIALSLALLIVIFLFDRSKVFLRKLSKKKGKPFIDKNKPLIEGLLPDNEFK